LNGALKFSFLFTLRQLVDDGYVSAAAAVSSATMTPLSSSIPFGRLHQLVLLGLQMEKEKGISTISPSNYLFLSLSLSRTFKLLSVQSLRDIEYCSIIC
jgi:hypothetical protein